MGILTFITFVPLLGALAILFVPKEKVKAIQGIGIGSCAIAFLLSIYTLVGFDPGPANIDQLPMQFIEKASWIPTFHIYYHMGVDGLSLPMILLTTLLCLLAAVYALNITMRVKEFFFWYLLPASSARWTCFCFTSFGS